MAFSLRPCPYSSVRFGAHGWCANWCHCAAERTTPCNSWRRCSDRQSPDHQTRRRRRKCHRRKTIKVIRNGNYRASLDENAFLERAIRCSSKTNWIQLPKLCNLRLRALQRRPRAALACSFTSSLLSLNKCCFLQESSAKYFMWPIFYRFVRAQGRSPHRRMAAWDRCAYASLKAASTSSQMSKMSFVFCATLQSDRKSKKTRYSACLGVVEHECDVTCGGGLSTSQQLVHCVGRAVVTQIWPIDLTGSCEKQSARIDRDVNFCIILILKAVR